MSSIRKCDRFIKGGSSIIEEDLCLIDKSPAHPMDSNNFSNNMQSQKFSNNSPAHPQIIKNVY